MATNRVFKDGRYLSVTCSNPTTPASGDPVRIGILTGVAITDERADGTTTVDLGPAVYDLSVKGVNDEGNSAVAAGDALYYVDGDTPKVSKKNAGYFVGYALEAVSSGATATIQVLVVVSGPGGTAELGSALIGAAQLIDGSVTGPKLAAGILDLYSVAANDETSDATYTVTGVAVGDEVAGVLFLSTAASVATIAVLPASDYTVTGANEITSGNPVDRSNDQLIFLVIDKT